MAAKFKNASAFLLRGARHAIVEEIQKLKQDSLFLSTYKGGSHLQADIYTKLTIWSVQ